MNTNKEFLTKMIRVSPSVKKRMEIFQGGDSDGIGGKEN